MTPVIKKTIAAVLSGGVLVILYYGTFLPLRKSQQFIGTLNNLGSARSIDDFQERLSVPLDAPSPIGQEELVRNASNVIMNLMQQSDTEAETIALMLEYLDRYYSPILDRGKGMSFGQNLYIAGVIYEFAAVKTKNPDYLARSKEYFLRGLELGPNRPQSLYGLLDIYRLEGNAAQTRTIAERILELWPEDGRVRDLLNNMPQG